jgi:PAS domain S-box-containing protein
MAMDSTTTHIDFRLLLEQLPAIVWATDRELRFVYARGAGLVALGLGADEVVGRSLQDYLVAEADADASATLNAHRAALEGVPAVYEDYWQGRAYQVHVEPWRSATNGIVGTLAVALDITDHMRAEEALAGSERELADFFDSAPIGLKWIGPNGVVLYANQAELDLLGYARGEYVGRHIADFHADGDVLDDILARLNRGETLQAYEARLRARDGSIKHVLISANVRWQDGHFVHSRCFTRDITDRRRMEEARQKADLLQHVAGLAHAAAHEINNPLAVVSGHIDLLARRAVPETTPHLDACREAVRRIAEILSTMNSLAQLELARGWPADLPPMLDLRASSVRDGRAT